MSDHPANAGLRSWLKRHSGWPKERALVSPDDVADPYYTLGTHPDLVQRLWEELPRLVARDCRAVFYATPVLVHPSSGIVFAFARGTHTYALRLPQKERDQALAAGAAVVLHYPAEPPLAAASFGPEWVFGGWLSGEEAWCLAAYELAGRG